MPKYSRTSKYEELRSRLQNDAESGIQTSALNPYEQRLNKAAPQQFDAPESPQPEVLDPIHARRSAGYTAGSQQDISLPEPDVPAGGAPFSSQYFKNNANYTTAFNNEYMNEYINEVKKYNIDQGNAMSANTDLDILRGLRGEKPVPARQPVPSTPYPEEPQPQIQPQPVPQVQPQVQIKPLTREEKKEERQAAPAYKAPDTADISFPARPKSVSSTPAPKPKSDPRPSLPFLDDDDDEYDDYDTYGDTRGETRPMSKDDIAAEVQRLINGKQGRDTGSVKDGKYRYDDTSEGEYYEDRSTRQQLLNETTQMRAQLDDYEDNLNDVNDKMKHTNQILNIVLIILIIALALVLAVVIYWVLLSKGVLS